MKCTIEELITINLAHTIEDGEVGFTGLATGDKTAIYVSSIPIAAMEFAKKTHAPNLTILLCGWLVNPDLSKLDFMPDSEFDNQMINLPCEAYMVENPALWSHKIGEISFGFGSGVQVDKFGNLNSTSIGSTEFPPKVQLVGPIFLPEHMAYFGREYIMMPHHEIRNFVEKVDHISGVGYPGGKTGRDKLGLTGKGPAYIYTSKCIFSFDEKGEIYVESIHPEVEKEDLNKTTGFDLRNLDEVPVTKTPTCEELKVLRREVDPKNILNTR